MWKLATIVVLFVAVAFSGCSEDKSAIDTVKDKASDVADDAKNKVGDAAEHAGDAAGEMASGAMEQMKAQFEKQLGSFDDQLSSLKSKAAEHANDELNSYVGTIGTKLTEAKKAMADAMSGQDFDMGKVKSMMTSMIAELTGLFNAANDKMKSLES